jgi:hypothetical protein
LVDKYCAVAAVDVNAVSDVRDSPWLVEVTERAFERKMRENREKSGIPAIALRIFHT